MKRLLAALAAVFAMLGPVAAVPATAQTEPAYIAGNIDAYWESVFAANGQVYWGPGIEFVYGDRLTPCGFIDPYNFGPAAYCPGNREIYLSPVWLGPGTDASLWYVALAHEWGHHIESLLGYSPEPSMESELRTDCMAGSYLGAAVQAGYAPRGAYNGTFYLMLLFGDPDYLPDELDSHGSGADRAKAFNTGYSGGIASCDVGLS
jgi:uncharacterized protein